MHVLRGGLVGDKSHQPPVAVVRQGQARLLKTLPEDAVFRTLSVLKLASHADPFPLVHVVVFLYPVEHQVLVPPLQIAQGGIQHALSSPSRGGAPLRACLKHDKTPKRVVFFRHTAISK